jgi:hypothetical protein
MKGGRGKRQAGSGKSEAGSGPIPFADVMRGYGMATPEVLERSMRDALGGASSASPDAILTAAERLLEHVLAGECESRDSALDLLTVDALVTKAMEIAARDPDLIARFPALAMKRLASR